MKIYICGIDGYLGWSLACYLAKRGHTIAGCDNGIRRQRVKEVGAHSIIPISTLRERQQEFKRVYPNKMHAISQLDLTKDYELLKFDLLEFNPDTVVHLGEQPSAPYSMIDREHAFATQYDNVLGTLNLLWAIKETDIRIHLLKVGTMGEFGVPKCSIPEGSFPANSIWLNSDRKIKQSISGLFFHRAPGSFYHCTKVQDTINIDFACRVWGLKSTDIMQGVVYGSSIPEFNKNPILSTRFDADESFGTAINRFVASSIIGHPMTLYGQGHQKRGYLPLIDSMQCFTIAIENPPESDDAGSITYPSDGIYRVWNQFEAVYDITDLAKKVFTIAQEYELSPAIKNYTNPRVEAERHQYTPIREGLLDHGYQPTQDMLSMLRIIFSDLLPYKDRIEIMKDTIIPQIKWDGTKEKSKEILNG